MSDEHIYDRRSYPQACGKVKFPDAATAERVLRHILATKTWRRKKPCRVYECDGCGGAHITHLPAYNDNFTGARHQVPERVQRTRAKRADDALARAKAMREQAIAQMNAQRSA